MTLTGPGGRLFLRLDMKKGTRSVAECPSPPHMRGTLQLDHSSATERGITPAAAGKPTGFSVSWARAVGKSLRHTDEAP
ncbi:hypothetical protein FDH10_gp26 [Propionibacterium phage Doucette]|uniref:Uncharacterized protein n=1 Tax=Propionibacterium phage Doucette TaxID=1897534 RepID=A0A1D8ETR6_9CAUD|nr:hypothetical protein FDH10_gp26 [Propionibacterium phage Doucette]AOT24439.1 hypothetical protein DOUCETTE_26 [Propionibacterium phage Doucette]